MTDIGYQLARDRDGAVPQSDPIDLGDNHTIILSRWPADIATGDEPWHAATVDHLTPAGDACQGFINLDVPAMRELWPTVERWTVESLEPLTLSPSLLCACGDHGFRSARPMGSRMSSEWWWPIACLINALDTVAHLPHLGRLVPARVRDWARFEVVLMQAIEPEAARAHVDSRR